MKKLILTAIFLVALTSFCIQAEKKEETFCNKWSGNMLPERGLKEQCEANGCVWTSECELNPEEFGCEMAGGNPYMLCIPKDKQANK